MSAIAIPPGHWVPDDASPLLRLVMRNLAAAHIGDPAGKRQSLGEWLLEKGGGPDRPGSSGDLFGMAKHVLESLPAEVWILRGGCGGENTVASWTEEGLTAAREQFKAFWDDADDDPFWAILERIPLVKRGACGRS